MIYLLLLLHFVRIIAEVCSPKEGAQALTKEGCPDLFDAYQCGDKIEDVTYSKSGEKCMGVWHTDWEFEIIDNAMHFHDIQKSAPAKLDGTDIIFEKKHELRRWTEFKPIRELEEALARMESGELTVKSWREEPELTLEEEIGVMHAVADAFEFHGYEEHAIGLRKEAATLSTSRRRQLKLSLGKFAKNGMDFCDKTATCEAAFKVGLDHVLGLSSSAAVDFCKKHHDKMDYMPLTCCGGTQCLFYCMSNPADSCAEIFAPKEPIHCCDDYDYNSQSMRCYKEKEVCPPGMTSCSLASVFAPAAYCSRGAGACWEKVGELVVRVADVALSIGSMIFSAGASSAAKAGIKAGAIALKTVAKSAARSAMKTAMKTAFKEIGKALKRGMIEHFKGVTQEIIFTHIVEEVSMTVTAQRAQAEGTISADDMLGMVDPTGIYELVGFFNSFEDCHYVDVPTLEELMDIRLESLKKTQDLQPEDIGPYYGYWKGRYLKWPSYRHVEMHIGCDGSLSITGLESQLMIFDTSYAQDMCGTDKPWSFVVHDLWGTEYLDCGYINGLIFMQRFTVPDDDSRAQRVVGYEFLATPNFSERSEMPCQDENALVIRNSDFFVDFKYEFSSFGSTGCDEYLTESECRELATTNRFAKFENLGSNSHVIKGCFANSDGNIYYNSAPSDGSGSSLTVPVCKKRLLADYELPSGAFVNVHAGGTNACTEYLFSPKCMEFAEMIGDTDGLDEYYRFDWPQGCLVDFHSSSPRVLWNYVPDGGRGESDMDVAPVCRACPNEPGCGYTPQLSYENRENHFYVYRSKVVSTLIESLSHSQAEDFCIQQGLVLASPRNGYEIKEILNQASNLIVRPVEREDSGVGDIAYQSSGHQGGGDWGDFYAVDGDQTPKIAIGLKCSKYDDCSRAINWHWSDYSALSDYENNFAAYYKGTLTEWLTLEPLTANEQEEKWEHEQRDAFGCGYYDYDFFQNKHHLYEPTHFREEVIRCREIFHQFRSMAGSARWDDFRAIEAAGPTGHDQCAYIDWEAESDGRTTISSGACDREEYVLFACAKQTNPDHIVPKENRSCQDRYFITDDCQTLQNRERCLMSTEDLSVSSQNCVWCSHGPCTANGVMRCATEQFLSSQSDSLSTNPEEVGITSEKTEMIDSVSSYEQCKIVFNVVDAAELFTSTGCQVQGACVSSHNYPSNYGPNEKCTIQILKDVKPVVGDVFIEQSWDRLWVGDVDVRDVSRVPTSIKAGTEIRWTSDDIGFKKGWKMCFELESTAAQETYEQEALSFIQVAETYTSFFPYATRIMAMVGVCALFSSFFQCLSKETSYTNIHDLEEH